MLHLLQPIWLLASAGIVIPVAIHLWNIKQGKTIKIGSIELLAKASQQPARSLRITELLLLLLRCLLIILLALLLAGPRWQNIAKQKGWVVMARQHAKQAYSQYKPLIDSLLQAGYAFHLFEKRFAAKELSSVLVEENETTEQNDISYWQLVKMLDQQVLPGTHVYLFTDNEIRRFRGERPMAEMALVWKTVTRADSMRHFISHAYLGNNDSIAVTTGESGPGGTTYRFSMLAKNKPEQKGISLTIMEGQLHVQYNNDTPVPVDTGTLHITVFADTYIDDTRYVEAAIRSIQEVKKRKIDLHIVNRTAEIPGKQDWIFWLSELKLPLQMDATHIVHYVHGDFINIHSWIRENDIISQTKTELYKRVSYPGGNGDAIWRDGFGMPLLIKETADTKQQYHLYTHFNPSWNEMAWSGSFPDILYELIEPHTVTDTNDRRVIDPEQLQLPPAGSRKKDTGLYNNDTKEAEHVLWMIALLVFVTERIFSFRRAKEKVHAE